MLTTANEMIKQNVIEQLTRDTIVNTNNLSVSVRNGKVELTGQVPSVAAKVMAERNSYEVQGVEEVDNRLEVSAPVKRRGSMTTRTKTM
jgi:osmotically-inducible protein OsmY